jgi:hypothetical protein
MSRNRRKVSKADEADKAHLLTLLDRALERGDRPRIYRNGDEYRILGLWQSPCGQPWVIVRVVIHADRRERHYYALSCVRGTPTASRLPWGTPRGPYPDWQGYRGAGPLAGASVPVETMERVRQFAGRRHEPSRAD